MDSRVSNSSLRDSVAKTLSVESPVYSHPTLYIDTFSPKSLISSLYIRDTMINLIWLLNYLFYYYVF